MGLLFTTEGTRRVINTLNTAFDESDSGLKFIRGLVIKPTLGAPAGSPLFVLLTSQWAPGALATILDLMPYDQGSGNGNDGNGPNPSNSPTPINRKHAKRWNFFLASVVGPSTAFAPLQAALASAILDTAVDANQKPIHITRVSFDHVEIDQNLTAPGNATPCVVVFDAPLPFDTTSPAPNPLPYLRHITLFTVRVPSKQPGSAFGKSTIFNANNPAPWNSDASQ